MHAGELLLESNDGRGPLPKHGHTPRNYLHVQCGRCGVPLYYQTAACVYDWEAKDGLTYEDGCYWHSVHCMRV